MHKTNIEISTSSILYAIGVVLCLFFLYRLKDLIMLIFLAIIFTSALNPFVTMLQKRKIPRSFSILLVYLSFITLVVAIFSFIFPPLIRESINLLTKLNLPQMPKIIDISLLQDVLQNYSKLLSNVGTSIPSVINILVGTFSGLLTVFTFFVLTYYLLSERQNLHTYLVFFGHEQDEGRAKSFINSLEKQLGGWVRAELLLMFIIGLMTYIGLMFLNIPYALPLAILAGLLEAIPNIGPTVSAIPSVILAFFTISPAMGIVVILLYTLIQQLENNIIVPKIMSSSVNISPLIAILVLITGIKLGGILGAVLSIPLFIFFRTFMMEFYDGKNPLRKTH